MNISFANRLRDENKSGAMEESMMEPKKNDMSGVLQTSVSVMNSEKGQQAFPRKPVGLTITVARIDLVLAGVRAQIEHLRWHRINL
jgi:hypothetical protein